MLKATGIVRKLDELGRVVIPAEIRRTMGMKDRQELEIYVEGDRILLGKHEASCTFCGSAEGIQEFKGRHVCQACRGEMKR
jgi:transcriptional pleiotropic regulator of transition state genes